MAMHVFVSSVCVCLSEMLVNNLWLLHAIEISYIFLHVLKTKARATNLGLLSVSPMRHITKCLWKLLFANGKCSFKCKRTAAAAGEEKTAGHLNCK